MLLYVCKRGGISADFVHFLTLFFILLITIGTLVVTEADTPWFEAKAVKIAPRGTTTLDTYLDNIPI